MNYAKNKIKIAVGISGAGRSLENLIRNQSQHQYEIVAVFSSNNLAKGKEFAIQNKINFKTFDFHSTQIVDELSRWLQANRVELIALAGFIKKFPNLANYAGRVINIHPALLPDFGGQGMYGLKVHEAVLRSGRKISGATVHVVNERYDEGQIIGQITVNIENCTDAKQIAATVFSAECKLYPKAIDFYYACLLDPVSRPPLLLKE